MKFGYSIIYVANVQNTLDFFSQAFGFKQKFVHESGDYGELDTGATTLAFAAKELGNTNVAHGLIFSDEAARTLGFEVAFVTDNVKQAHSHAITNGAIELSPPKVKPWGQTVSYVKTPDGVLVELCTPVAG